MTKHTPGPWRVSRGAVVADHPVPEIGGSDATDYYGGHLIAESIAPQNRAVIAAAPDMLAALKMVTATCGPSAYWDGETRAFLEAAEAAIAKAEPDAAPDIAPSTRAALGAALARVPEKEGGEG